MTPRLPPRRPRRPRQIVTWIMGGLGNQMFQYAAALALARRADAEVHLDLDHFTRYPLRSFALQAFGIKLAVWHGRSPAYGAWGKLRRGHQHLVDRRWLPQLGQRLFQERGFPWQELPINGWQELYLLGFWQSHRYFQGSEGEIRRQFDVSRFATPDVAPLLSELDTEYSVAIHVRRGDYATNPEALHYHGLCSVDWYHAAITLVRGLVPGCRFHVFSDDTAVAAEMFRTLAEVTIHPTRTQEQDLLLMSRCRHHIIANSSFSWWSAWLDGRAGSVVVAPRQWFTPEQMLVNNTVDLFPPGWILL